MAVKKSPRTPRTSTTAVKTDSTPRPTRSSGRNSTQTGGQNGRATTPDSSTEELKGSVSPYFSNTTKRSRPTPVQNKRKGNGKSSETPTKPTPSGRGKGKGKPPVKKPKLKKDPEDVTGMTDTEEESESGSEDGDTEDDFAPSDEDDEEEEVPESEDESEGSGDSDAFDDTPNRRKRKGAAAAKSKKSNKKTAATQSKSKKGGKHAPVDGYEDEVVDSDIELEEGQEIAGRIYPAPKTGQVPPGRISQNTLNFLKNLQIPERNDREWFRSHEPSYRQAEKEWKAFVGTVQLKMQESDPQLPLLPPKDVIHRIYRDVRFSSDKTPYKRSFSLSTSRSGRKGLWAGYHLSISPNDKSIIACGVWCPAKEELATIRHHILNTPERLRSVIGDEEFVKMFGPAKPHKDGKNINSKRQNVFGHEDALKVAPKGVDKDHKDIDLLKLRSVAVVHHFSDEEVIDPDFQDNVARVMQVMRPLVHILNDFIALPP